MGTEGRNRIGYERKDENERNGVKADKKKGDKKRVGTGGKLEENEEKRMEVKMIGCELGDGGEGKCRRKEMGTGRKKRDKLWQLKMKAETR